MATQSWLTNAATAQRFQLLSVGQKFAAQCRFYYTFSAVCNALDFVHEEWKVAKALRQTCVSVVKGNGKVSKRRLCKAMKIE